MRFHSPTPSLVDHWERWFFFDECPPLLRHLSISDIKESSLGENIHKQLWGKRCMVMKNVLNATRVANHKSVGRGLIVVMAILSMAVVVPLQNALALPGDYTWVTLTAGLPASADWYSIAASSDGTKLAAVANARHIYTSTDSGLTWTERTTSGLRGWRSISSNVDGTRLAAIVSGGYIYTSTDSGATWTERTGAGLRNWRSIATSIDGTKLVAVGGGAIYTSTDSGMTWMERVSAGTRQWETIASSADGTKLFAGVNNGALYISVDSGTTWSEIVSLNNSAGWYNLAMSGDGNTLVAVDTYGVEPASNGGYVYISRDGGVTWEEQSALGVRYWNDGANSGIASSADGQTIMISDSYGADWNGWGGGYLYVTRDGGITWEEQTDQGARPWSGLAISAGGSKIAVGDYGGSIYLGTLEGAATDTFALSSLSSSTPAAISQSTLSVTSETCYTISDPSVAALSSSGVTPPDASISIVGGLAFNVSCVSSGGTADVSLALGAHYSDLSKVRIYKSNGLGGLTDITSSVTLSNPTSGGSTKTTISYSAIDGGAFDEDAAANSTIVDPIYIGVLGDPAGNELAATGVNLWLTLGAAGVAIAGSGGALTYIARRHPR